MRIVYWLGMAQGSVVIEHPNRDKAESRATKTLVVALLLVSVAIMAIVTVGGWDTLQGAKSLQIAYILVYLVLAFQIGRWRSGLLPVAAALAIVLLIFAAISGPEWFARDRDGFSNPLIDESLLGLLTVLLVPVQLALILFAARGFSQKWSVEVERGGGPGPRAPQPA
jgi:presenilin-like A22 family membrane protease